MSPRVISNFDFESRLALQGKWDNFNWILIRACLEKYLLANDTKYRQIIYRWKEFFITSTNIRNRYLKIKLCMAWIYLKKNLLHGNVCQRSWHFCQKIESTNLKGKLRWVIWDPIWPSKLAGERQFYIVKQQISLHADN